MAKTTGEQSVKFDRVQDVPGFNYLAENGFTNIINFLHNNLDDVDLCLQAVKNETTDLIVYDENKKIISAVGWHVNQVLGRGKDGFTFLGYRYNDNSRINKTVKCLSKYAKQYLNHTLLFAKMHKTANGKNNNFFDLHIADNYTYYNSSKPLIEVNADDLNNSLAILCRMNSWSIRNTGFAFWDFGFSSGKNYMVTKDNALRWVDYGGAGMVRCPNFESIYSKNSSLPKIELVEPFEGKESLVIANSDFLMCQFLLHIEYWKNQKSTNADIWSSMLQIKPSVVKEFSAVIPSLLSTSITKDLYNSFKYSDWTDDITWKQVGKYIDANT
jgi:hypothetical protein